MSLIGRSFIGSAATMLAITTALPVFAFEVNSQTVIVDDLTGVENGDWFSGSDLRFISPTSVALEVASGGGCKPHDYTLSVSRAFKESFPPIVEARLTLNKNGDACKAIVSDVVTFDLGALDAVGPHVVEIAMGFDTESILVNFEAPVDAETATIVPLQIGEPTDLGDALASMANATLIDGVVGPTVTVDVTYSGGCKEHDFEAWWDGSYDKSLPPRANIVLVHKANGDNCRALLNELVQIGVDDIMSGQPDVIPVIHSLGVPSLEAVEQ